MTHKILFLVSELVCTITAKAQFMEHLDMGILIHDLIKKSILLAKINTHITDMDKTYLTFHL